MTEQQRPSSTTVKSRIGFHHWLRPELTVLLLGLLTAGLMIWQHWGMNRILVLEPGKNYGAWAEADAQNQGMSQAEFEETDAFIMRCEVSDVIPSPYCNMFIPVVPEGVSGIDLTPYTTLSLDAEYESSKRDTLRAYINHFYTDEAKEGSRFDYKLNQTIVVPADGRTTYKLSLSEFYVPSWWVYYSELRHGRAGPKMTNARHIVLSTGDSAEARTVILKVYRAELQGKWIDAETLYRGLLWGWMGLILIYLLWRGFQLRREVLERNKKAERLEVLNRVLDLRSKRYEALAKHDDLTGVLNRAGIHEVLKSAVNEHESHTVPFSVLMLDIDHFKSINDTYGHETGDQVLRGLVEVLGERCRDTDVLARWGGEEFLIVCRGSTQRAAAILAEDLCRAVREAHLLDSRQVTCSIGVAEMRDNDISGLFRRADEALYRAKSDGRDQVKLAD